MGRRAQRAAGGHVEYDVNMVNGGRAIDVDYLIKCSKEEVEAAKLSLKAMQYHGTDAQDWTEMLMRMYNRWADKQGFDIEILAVSEGTEAGLSNVEFLLNGLHAFGLMQAEKGVHRLVRI